MCNNKNIYTSKCVDLAVYVDRYKKNTSKYKKGHLCYAVLYNVRMKEETERKQHRKIVSEYSVFVCVYIFDCMIIPLE